MAAPSIPNLLTGLKSRGGGGGLGGGGGGAGRVGEGLRRGGGRSQPLRSVREPDTPPPEQSKEQNDVIVQATDTDANLSRLSAVAAGYLQDEFAEVFKPPGEIQKRYPIINRGTYARTTAIDRLVEGFIASSPSTQKQIVSLGAGSDTRYFRLMQAARMSDPPRAPPNILYHELDFPSNAAKKASAILASPRLRDLVGDPILVRSSNSEELHGPHYHIHALDLRDLSAAPRPWNEGKRAPHLSHLDPALPTLLISECCLTYLAPDAADAVVLYFSTKALAPSTPLGLALYEPINPFDAFGRTMVSNLAKRGIVLQTMRKYHSLGAQRARLKAYGLRDGAGAVDVDFLLKTWIDEDEQARIARVEMLDEVEELNLLAKHYCIAWGWRDGDELGTWDKWKELEEREE